MLRKRLLAMLFSVIAAVALIATPVLAYVYYAAFTITESGGTAYSMLPAGVASNNLWMANNGFMLTSALDTRVETLGGLARPHMVTDNFTWTSVAVPANSQTNLYFTTGSTPLSAMYIIPGLGGYFTAADVATSELGNNLSVELSGYINTDNATSKNFATKSADTFSFFVDPNVSGKLVAGVAGTGNYTDQFVYDLWTDVGATIGVDTGADQRLEWDVLMNADNRAYRDLASNVTVSDNFWQLNFAFTPSTHPVDNGNQMYVGLFSSATNPNGYAADGITFHYIGAATETARITRWDAGAAASQAGITGIAHGTTYYVTLSRTSLTAVTLGVFTDAGRTTHATGSPLSLVVPATITNLRYIQVSNDNGGVGGQETGYLDNLQFINGRTVSATGITGGEKTIRAEQKTGISLDGTNDLISYGDPGDGDLDVGTGNFTVELVLAAQQDATERGLIGKGNTVAPAAGIFDVSIAANNRLIATMYNSTLARSLTSTSAANYLSDNLTHRIGIAVNRTSNIVDIYVDGVEVTYVSDSSVVGGFSAADSLDTTKYFVIGGYGTAADTSNRQFAGAPAKGTIYEARLYKRYIGASEMLAHAQGTFSDNSNLMLLTRFNEGSGNTSTDSSGNGNTGTGYSGAGASATWWARQSIYVDGDQQGINDYSTPVSVPDNANSWTYMQNNNLLYAEYVTVTVSGTLQAWYQPNSMIIGTALPDRQGGDNPGTFTWGSNPSGVTVTLGSLIATAQPTLGESTDRSTRDILPEAGSSDWHGDGTITKASTLANPVRPFITMVSDNTTLTEIQVWRWLGLALWLSITVWCARKLRGHQGITAIIAGVILGGLVAFDHNIFPFYLLVLTIVSLIFGVIAERAQSI